MADHSHTKLAIRLLMPEGPAREAAVQEVLALDAEARSLWAVAAYGAIDAERKRGATVIAGVFLCGLVLILVGGTPLASMVRAWDARFPLFIYGPLTFLLIYYLIRLDRKISAAVDQAEQIYRKILLESEDQNLTVHVLSTIQVAGKPRAYVFTNSATIEILRRLLPKVAQEDVERWPKSDRARLLPLITSPFAFPELTMEALRLIGYVAYEEDLREVRDLKLKLRLTTKLKPLAIAAMAAAVSACEHAAAARTAARAVSKDLLRGSSRMSVAEDADLMRAASGGAPSSSADILRASGYDPAAEILPQESRQ